jgi:cardiolipin synthase
MEEMYCRDLENSTEIVISDRRRVRRAEAPERKKGGRRQRTSRKGSATRAAAGVIGVGSTVGAAITNRRVLGPAEARVMFMAACLLFLLSMVAVKWPRGVTFPLAFIGTWVAIALFIRAWKLRKGAATDAKDEQPPAPAPAREEG